MIITALTRMDKKEFSASLLTQSLYVCTVGKIYTPIFSFFWKRVVNIVISELRPVSNERSGNFTFIRGFHEILNSPIFEKSK